jgi:TRAP-type transport system periplasmic protein
MKKFTVISCIAILTVVLVMSGGTSFAAAPELPKPITLSLATMFPPQSLEATVPVKFAERIAQATNGQLTIRIYSAPTLLPPPEMIDGVKKGSADMSHSLIYKPLGVELSMALSNLMIASDAYTGGEMIAKVFEQFADHMAKEWKGTEIIAMTSATPIGLFTTRKKVQTMEDMKGLQIRVPTPEQVKVVTKLKGTPVNLSTADMAAGLEKGTVDGSTGMIGMAKGFKLQMLKYAIRMRQSCFGNAAPIFLIINKDTWDKLHPTYKKAINDNRKWVSQLIMDTWTQVEEEGGAYIKGNGGDVYYLSREEEAKWSAIRAEVQDETARSLDAKGIPGTEVLKFIRKIEKTGR